MYQDALEQAKRLLRNNGYVVIPDDRRLILTVSRASSKALVETMSPELLPKYLFHCDQTAAFQLGKGLQDSKAIIKKDKGLHDWGYHTEHSVGVILPRAEDDNR